MKSPEFKPSKLSNEEISKAENMMTPSERASSREREQAINFGIKEGKKESEFESLLEKESPLRMQSAGRGKEGTISNLKNAMGRKDLGPESKRKITRKYLLKEISKLSSWGAPDNNFEIIDELRTIFLLPKEIYLESEFQEVIKNVIVEFLSKNINDAIELKNKFFLLDSATEEAGIEGLKKLKEANSVDIPEFKRRFIVADIEKIKSAFNVSDEIVKQIFPDLKELTISA